MSLPSGLKKTSCFSVQDVSIFQLGIKFYNSNKSVSVTVLFFVLIAAPSVRP
jgi:hypothetical protein